MGKQKEVETPPGQREETLARSNVADRDERSSEVIPLTDRYALLYCPSS